MKRLALLIALLGAPGFAFAQEAVDGGQAAPPNTVPTNQPSGLLTPPPDNAPVTAPSTTTTTTKTTSSTTASAPAPMSESEIAHVQQQEIIRRQELIFRANESLKQARSAELAMSYPEARKDYLFSAEAFGSISRSTDSYAMAAEGLTRVDFQLYDDALKNGDTARAGMLIAEVIKYNPNNAEANKRMAAINRALSNPNDTSLLGNPAITPGFVDKANEVQQLFAEAEQFRRTGQYDEAEKRLKRILGIDPYNIGATKELERIDAEKNKYDDVARQYTREERLRQVEEKWYEPITNKEAGINPQEAQPELTRATTYDIDQKLKNIFLSLDFTDATIEEATNFLSIESKRLDPDKKGINFIIQPEASSTAKPVTLTLNNVPLGEALRYICQLSNTKFKVQDYAISVVPFTSSTDDLISRTFIVQPSFVTAPTAAGAIGSATEGLTSARPIAPTPGTEATAASPDTGDEVKQALIAKGVKFPPGASAVYTPTTGQLTVVDTADQMELLEELVNAGQAPTLMVKVACKFVEINQTDLNDLTVNTAVTPPHLVGPSTSSSNFYTQLPGALGFTPDSIDALINPQNLQENQFGFRGNYSGSQFNILISALAQKTSFDLLSDPTVLTKSGDQGVLEAVRVFPYPISFDPPELVTQNNNAGAGLVIITETPPAVIATTPTDFKRRNVGVRLVVKPQVAADNKNIDLALFPEVTDFEGFINYGSEISIADPTNPPGTSLLSANEINQPVFNTRRINTKIVVRDQSTVVMGGLLRDDIQTINDKVPILGDIPLIGRMFQSKAISNTKRNLLIFVTATIYRNDGELLNAPEQSNATQLLTGTAGFTPATATATVTTTTATP